MAGERLSGCCGDLWIVEISGGAVTACSSESWLYKWSINRVTNPNLVYSHTYYVKIYIFYLYLTIVYLVYRSWPVLRYCPEICLDRLRQTARKKLGDTDFGTRYGVRVLWRPLGLSRMMQYRRGTSHTWLTRSRSVKLNNGEISHTFSVASFPSRVLYFSCEVTILRGDQKVESQNALLLLYRLCGSPWNQNSSKQTSYRARLARENNVSYVVWFPLG
jgi:hypothetical protein